MHLCLKCNSKGIEIRKAQTERHCTVKRYSDCIRVKALCQPLTLKDLSKDRIEVMETESRYLRINPVLSVFFC